MSALGADSEADVERDGSEATLATFGTTGRALIASDGIRMPGVTFGETGRSFRGLESLCVGTLRETARCNAPREAIDPPRSTISWRDCFAPVFVSRGRDAVVDDCDLKDRAAVDCGDDEDETARC